jgi:hypothetical protein
MARAPPAVPHRKGSREFNHARRVAATLELNTRVQAFGEGDIVCGCDDCAIATHGCSAGGQDSKDVDTAPEGPPLPPPR